MINGQKIEYYENRRLKGKKTPLDNRPENSFETQTYIDLFFSIGHFRSNDMSVGSLNLKDIIDYYNHVEPYGNLREYIRILTAMDSIYIKFHTKDKK